MFPTSCVRWLLVQTIWPSFLFSGPPLPFNSIFSLSVFRPVSSCYPLLFFPHCFLSFFFFFLTVKRKSYSWHFVQEANRFYLGGPEQGGFCRSWERPGSTLSIKTSGDSWLSRRGGWWMDSY